MAEWRDVLRRLTAGMSGRRTNLAILVLLAATWTTGALNFAAGTGWVVWPTVTHGVVGLGLVLVSGWKWTIVRRGLDRRPPTRTWPSLLLGLLVVVAITSGVLHTTGLVLGYGPLGSMQVHVGAALLALPLALWHALGDHDTLPGRADLTRRNLLRSALLLGSAGALWATTEAVVHAAGLPGARRRDTGSYEQGSHDPSTMPSIIWLFDPRLELAPAAWRCTVVDGLGRRTLALEDLELATRGSPDRWTATLDCTSGWWAEQTWHGVRLDRLVTAVPDGARSLVVGSATGYRRRFPLRDLPNLLLATGYEGRPLAARHGAPARLVAPGRRGFWWVKWVTQVEVDDAPWWRQSPYPTQ